MPYIDTTINPISIVAFVLTCLGWVQPLVAILVTNWWSLDYPNRSRTYYGVWSTEDCKYDGGECRSVSGNVLEGGQETLFISKVFATFTVFLTFVAVVLHIVYFFIRHPAVRTAAVFMNGSGGLFGLLAVFVFVGFYNTVDDDSASIGVAFFLFLIGSIVCFFAGGFTAWAAVRKAKSRVSEIGGA
ncbi:hypothetical protein Btru_074933 [Bulinus truncatus]|nr:hypothetical protein Btru_074933 [Bulinus truncatus]